MADWSELPKELLRLISELIDSPFYLLRFRSVCSSWRSSSSPLPTHLPLKFPTFPSATAATPSIFSLSKRTLFLINPPHQTPHRSWLIKIGQDTHGHTLLFHPLSRFPIKSNSNSNLILNLIDLPVFDIEHEFILADTCPTSLNALYMEKVVFSWLGSRKDGFALLTIHISGRLALFRSGHPDWTIIPDMLTPYDDVCVHKGSLFAVDSTGRTVIVGLDLSLTPVADPVFGGDKKFLVACEGELFLVDKYLSSDYLCELGGFDDDDEDEIYELGCERAVRFEVYRLEEMERRWVEVGSLGDRVLFLGDDCAFSASASDLGVDRGGCVVFRDDTFNVNALESGLGVFHLDEGRISPLSDYPSISKLFWPPPDWDCLNGEFVRVGPNPKFAPVAGYHWFDGDGMIHGLRIKDGKATYVSRFVRTSRLKQEEYFGGAKFMKIGDLKGLLGLLMVNIQMLRYKLNVLDDSYGHGTDAIKVFEDGDLQTLGLMDYDKRLDHSFTAHPKVDPFTGEMFTFGYSQTPPYLTYRVISKDGFMHDAVPITISEPVMMHDFAITENYAIFMDLPLYFRPKDMVKEKKLIFQYDSTKKARFGVLPRYAKDEQQIRWFELPNCFIFHNANAWEEEDEVVLITCRLEDVDLDGGGGAVKETIGSLTNQLYEMRFNMKSGQASQKKLSEPTVDFPRVNESYTGRKQRYVYGTILSSMAKITGIVKFDLHSEPELGKTKLEVGGNVQGIYALGPGRFGSEAIYVPRVLGTPCEEDDGYLIFYVHDENTKNSYAHVIDAKTMSSDPVAIVELPARVPYGFHAFFVTEEQLQEQGKL
ncbi:hypothetical protein Ahy_B08g091105 isoform B [Arachis hypogaea]|uniref:carotenoid 9,10-dioxygenase n=1 Tax=Arachis hypogaea TaxID=3818 RepID=A0A444Y1K6_ARAHY|nr:hypothetical protein Ahy_B08g091105 isoform B [Arachis hypogaea]